MITIIQGKASKVLEQKPRQKGTVRLDLGQEDNRMGRLNYLVLFLKDILK